MKVVLLPKKDFLLPVLCTLSVVAFTHSSNAACVKDGINYDTGKNLNGMVCQANTMWKPAAKKSATPKKLSCNAVAETQSSKYSSIASCAKQFIACGGAVPVSTEWCTANAALPNASFLLRKAAKDSVIKKADIAPPAEKNIKSVDELRALLGERNFKCEEDKDKNVTFKLRYKKSCAGNFDVFAKEKDGKRVFEVMANATKEQACQCDEAKADECMTSKAVGFLAKDLANYKGEIGIRSEKQNPVDWYHADDAAKKPIESIDGCDDNGKTISYYGSDIKEKDDQLTQAKKEADDAKAKLNALTEQLKKANNDNCADCVIRAKQNAAADGISEEAINETLAKLKIDMKNVDKMLNYQQLEDMAKLVENNSADDLDDYTKKALKIASSFPEPKMQEGVAKLLKGIALIKFRNASRDKDAVSTDGINDAINTLNKAIDLPKISSAMTKNLKAAKEEAKKSLVRAKAQKGWSTNGIDGYRSYRQYQEILSRAQLEQQMACGPTGNMMSCNSAIRTVQNIQQTEAIAQKADSERLIESRISNSSGSDSNSSGSGFSF